MTWKPFKIDASAGATLVMPSGVLAVRLLQVPSVVLCRPGNGPDRVFPALGTYVLDAQQSHTLFPQSVLSTNEGVDGYGKYLLGEWTADAGDLDGPQTLAQPRGPLQGIDDTTGLPGNLAAVQGSLSVLPLGENLATPASYTNFTVETISGVGGSNGGYLQVSNGKPVLLYEKNTFNVGTELTTGDHLSTAIDTQGFQKVWVQASYSGAWAGGDLSLQLLGLDGTDSVTRILNLVQAYGGGGTFASTLPTSPGLIAAMNSTGVAVGFDTTGPAFFADSSAQLPTAVALRWNCSANVTSAPGLRFRVYGAR